MIYLEKFGNLRFVLLWVLLSLFVVTCRCAADEHHRLLPPGDICTATRMCAFVDGLALMENPRPPGGDICLAQVFTEKGCYARIIDTDIITIGAPTNPVLIASVICDACDLEPPNVATVTLTFSREMGHTFCFSITAGAEWQFPPIIGPEWSLQATGEYCYSTKTTTTISIPVTCAAGTKFRSSALVAEQTAKMTITTEYYQQAKTEWNTHPCNNPDPGGFPVFDEFVCGSLTSESTDETKVYSFQHESLQCPDDGCNDKSVSDFAVPKDSDGIPLSISQTPGSTICCDDIPVDCYDTVNGEVTLPDSTSDKKWHVARIGDVTANFADTTGLGIDLLYEVTTDKVGNLNARVFHQDCGTLLSDGSIAVDFETSGIMEGAEASEIGMVVYLLKLLVETNNLSQSETWTPTGPGNDGTLNPCVRVDLNTENGESVSFVKTVLQVDISMTSEFQVNAITVDAVGDDVAADNLDFESSLESCRCDETNVCLAEPILPAQANSVLRICVYTVAPTVEVTEILSMEIYQDKDKIPDTTPDLVRTPITDGINDELTVSFRTDPMKMVVLTQLTSDFFDYVPSGEIPGDINIEGTVGLAFATTRRLGMERLCNSENEFKEEHRNLAEEGHFQILVHLESNPEMNEADSSSGNEFSKNFVLIVCGVVVAGVIMLLFVLFLTFGRDKHRSSAHKKDANTASICSEDHGNQNHRPYVKADV